MPLRIERFDEGPLRLRSYERGDLDRLSSLLTDPVTMGPVGGPLRRDEVLGMLERYLAPEDPRYLVVVAAFVGETYVGSGRVVVSEDAPGVPEIGYLVASAHGGRGHGTHLARALVRIGHDLLGAPCVVARTHVSNAASARVLVKAGLVHDGQDGELVRFVSRREKMSSEGSASS